MDAPSKEGTPLKLDPKIQELYARLEEEKRKNRQLDELRKQNARLVAKVHQLETEKANSQKLDPETLLQKTRKKIALQEQLQEQKVRDKMLVQKQKRIELLIDSLEDQEEVQELDTKTIDELKSTLDSFIQGRKKRTTLIKKLNAQNEELSKKNEDLLFTRDKLAHDLRSLMSSILSTLSLLDLGEAEVVEQLLPSLEAKCKVFMDLVITLSENKINKDFLYVNDIAELLNLNPYEADSEIDLEVTGIDIPIFADKGALYDVIQNLVNNAIKYSGQSNDQLKLTLEVGLEASETILRFSDNGSGISAERQETVFDLYNRAGIDDGTGKGIGLFMVKKLVEGHQGKIRYNPEFEEGAQFILSLPNAPQI